MIHTKLVCFKIGIGAIASICLPLFGVIVSIGLGLSGGRKCPISWMLVLTSTLLTTWILGYFLERRALWNISVILINIILLLAAAVLGVIVGDVTAGFGLMGHDPSQDPSHGIFRLDQVLLYALVGTTLGFLLGIGSASLAKVWNTNRNTQTGLGDLFAIALSWAVAIFAICILMS